MTPSNRNNITNDTLKLVLGMEFKGNISDISICHVDCGIYKNKKHDKLLECDEIKVYNVTNEKGLETRLFVAIFRLNYTLAPGKYYGCWEITNNDTLVKHLTYEFEVKASGT